MKKIIAAFITIFFSYISLAFCAPDLTNKTFKVNNFKSGKESTTGLKWLVYFRSDGKAYYQVTKPRRTSVYYRTGRWEITKKEELCTTRFVRKKKDRKVTTCGTIEAIGQNNYKRYNDKGKLITTYTYVGAGKLFGKKEKSKK